MDFNSLNFLLFFFTVFIAYWSISKKYQWVLLLIVSYLFYLSWKPAYGWLLALSTIINYCSALGFERFPKRKKVILLSAVVFNFLCLFIFKYLNFFDYTVSQTLALFKYQIQLPQFEYLLPIGISFYTFQTVGYLIDVYTERIKAERHVGIFALFVLFFPKLVAGPIEKGKDLLPQLHRGKEFDYQQTVSGLKLFTYGLFKKVVIADNLRIVVDRVFSSLPEYKGLSLVLTIVFFSWQIYADFSGYTDMARGIARMLGYQLLENFNYPYLSTSLRDFWRRWHISLSTWLKDYIYIPLGGSRKGVVRTCLNTMIIFLICGLWHGASFNFILWGLFHGIIVSMERVLQYVIKGRFRIPRFVSLLYTYVVVCMSWVFFRASTFSDAIYIFRYSLVGISHFATPTYIFATLSKLFVSNTVEICIALFCLVCIVFLEVCATKKRINQFLNRQHIIVRFTFYTVILTVMMLLRNIGPTKFIYVQF